MEDMETGEYVRAKCGKIYRYVGVSEHLGKNMKDYEQDGETYQLIGDITKHSKNIIDILECGDYVNGYLVEEVKKEYVYTAGYGTIELKDIEEILTKEQYESNKYSMPEFKKSSFLDDL